METHITPHIEGGDNFQPLTFYIIKIMISVHKVQEIL